MPFASPLRALSSVASLAGLAACLTLGSPGSPDGGDPYYPTMGNGGYDVSAYVIDNTVNLAPISLPTGRTTITARATQDLSRFNLDISLTVDSVSVNGTPAAYALSGCELTVTPARGIAEGSEFTTVVTYHDDKRPSGWWYEKGEVLATGEPKVAQWWFPSNDTPRDAATFDVTLRVPQGQQAISVGRLMSSGDSAGRSVWRWRASEPMATYLAFFTAGRFDLASETVAGRPYVYAVSQRLSAGARATAMRMLKRTPALIAGLEQDYGPYPFADGGGVVTSTFRSDDYAMENQTRPTYPEMKDNVAGMRLMAHELSHQWFGNLVRVDRWMDIVDNEGQARWAEMRWSERNGGPSANAQLESMWAEHKANSSFWDLRLDDPGVGHIFDWPVYDRGGMMVQALRNLVGDTTFFQIQRTWIAERGWGTGRVSQFEEVAARVSGRDLDAFFDVWLRTPGRPAHTAANGFR